MSGPAPGVRYPRLERDLAALAEHGRDDGGGWSRPAFGAADQGVHAWFADLARDAGLAVRHDAFGNLIARAAGRSNGPAVVIGSHLDTVLNGGLLDGALGVLAGLEVVRRLREGGELRNPVEVIAFRDEEGRFGAYSGSRAMMGDLAEEALGKMRASDGTMLADAMRGAGFDPADLALARRDPSEIGAYLELHIEQGPVLEAAGRAVGVVTAIAGQERLSVRFLGAADHAGTTPMDMRRDAFAAAARFADRFRDLVLAEGGTETRGTIGIVKVLPNAGNVVPSEAVLGLEIRDTDAGRLAALAACVGVLAAETAAVIGVEQRVRRVYGAAPVPMDARLVALAAEAAADLGHTPVVLPSGAGHDAAVMGARVPAGLVFVPSIGGRSHCPEEATNWPDIEAGVAVLEAIARRLAAAPLPLDAPA